MAIGQDGTPITPIESIIDATAEPLRGVEMAMDKTYPIITIDNLPAFQNGNLPTARFYLGPDKNSRLTQLIFVALLERAHDPNDPIYCQHAARKHQKTYMDVLNELSISHNLALERQEMYRTDTRDGYIWRGHRFVIAGEKRLRETYVPQPLANYFEQKKRSSKPPSDRETVKMLTNPQFHVFASVISAIYMGIEPNRLMSRLSRTHIVGGVFAQPEVSSKLKADCGKLTEANIRKIRNGILGLADRLMVNGKGARFPSFSANSYIDAILSLQEQGIIPNGLTQNDMDEIGFGFVSYSHNVIPTLVLKGASEVAQQTAQATGLYGNYRTTAIMDLYRRHSTTDIVTAYFNFGEPTDEQEEQE